MIFDSHVFKTEKDAVEFAKKKVAEWWVTHVYPSKADENSQWVEWTVNFWVCGGK